MKQKILIIADDLTGTCDTNIKFLRPNTRVSSIVNPKDFTESILEIEDVVAVNTETRAASPQAAYDRVYNLTRKLDASDVTFIKKIDSVTRGNITAEIDALMDATHLDLAVVAPAYPDNGRQCIDGKLRLREDGAWLETPKSWVSLLQTSKRKTVLIPLAEVRKGCTALLSAVRSEHDRGAGIVVVDAECNQDLQVIARTIRLLKHSAQILPVGCAGLATFLSEELLNKDNNGYIFVVIGTQHPTTLRQVEYLKLQKNMTVYTLDVSRILAGDCEQEVQRIISSVEEDIAQCRIRTGIVLNIKGDADETKPLENCFSQAIVETLSKTCKAIFEKNITLFNKLLISGGDTANGVLDAFGIRCIHMHDEPLSGIAYGWADLHENRSNKVWIATKSGGFGEENTLDTLINYMSCTE